VIRAWNSLEFKVPSVDVGPVHFGGQTIGVPDVPTLHSGGIVPGRRGEEVLTLLEAGERVIPANGSDRPIHTHVYLDKREILSAISSGANWDRLGQSQLVRS
jgi:hypothetical protein